MLFRYKRMVTFNVKSTRQVTDISTCMSKSFTYIVDLLRLAYMYLHRLLGAFYFCKRNAWEQILFLFNKTYIVVCIDNPTAVGGGGVKLFK